MRTRSLFKGWTINRTRALLLSGLLLFSMALLLGCPDDSDVIPPAPPESIRLGAVLDRTGASASFGNPCAIACSLAALDVNEYLVENDIDLELDLVILDDQGDDEAAEVRLSNLTTDNIQYIIGPSTSAIAEAVRSQAQQHNAMMVSPSSVATSLADSTDTIYRLAPDDSHQSAAITAYMTQVDDIEAVITLYRDDVWGQDLYETTSADFEAAGIDVLQGIAYPTSTTDFTAYLDDIEDIVMDAIDVYSDTTIAVYMLTFNEAYYVFNSLQDHTLNAQEMIRFYGASAIAKSPAIFASSSVANLAAVKGFTCPVFAEQDNQVVDQLRYRIKLITDEDPGSYAFAAYDALWLGALAYIEIGEVNPDFDTLLSAFLQVSSGYEGKTGVIELNACGDRAFGDYDFWQIKYDTELEEFVWDKVAIWDVSDDGSTGSIVIP